MRERKKGSTYVMIDNIINYIEGFGSSASHSVIFQILFECFDVFSDIAYLIQLLTYSQQNSNNVYYFVIFVSSMLLTLFANSLLLFAFILREEFRLNKQFQMWFYGHSGMITCLMFLCLLTDLNMFTNLFTSQIFGKNIFYAPLTIRLIEKINIVSPFIALVFEHAPQLFVQFMVIWTHVNGHQVSDITIVSLIVSIIDLLFIAIKLLVWIVARSRPTSNNYDN